MPARKVVRKSPHYWLAERIADHPTAVERAMFGCNSFYLHGRLKLVLTPEGDEPWSGVLIPTFREFHASLREQFPELISHAVLGKWLYLSEQCEAFEPTSEKLIDLILRDDPRIGVEPNGPRRRSRRS